MGKFRPKKSKLSILTENWYTWCLGSADSESGLRFLKFRNPKFWANLDRKSQSCSVWLKISTECVSTMVILIPTLFFSVSNTKFFLDKFGQKSCLFWLKIGTHGISRMLILIPTTVFWIANSRSTFGQIWAEKVKAVCFAWKLVHTHTHTKYLENVDSYFDISFFKFKTKSWGCWFLFWD